MFLLSGASTDNLPPGVLYKVKATYKYQAEDMDELSFEVGELIDVIEYDDPEEQVSAGRGAGEGVRMRGRGHHSKYFHSNIFKIFSFKLSSKYFPGHHILRQLLL